MMGSRVPRWSVGSVAVWRVVWLVGGGGRGFMNERCGRVGELLLLLLMRRERREMGIGGSGSGWEGVAKFGLLIRREACGRSESRTREVVVRAVLERAREMV
jgi:hypothetical protein